MQNTQLNNFALCAATYRAAQVPGAVIIYAQGVHPTTGYQVFFEQLPTRIVPPQFSLRHVEPTCVVANVITPFEAQISFAAADTIEQVIVYDADGTHSIVVEQALHGAIPHANIVAIQTRTGGFVGIQETLTVYADGTLHLAERRFNQHQTRHLLPSQLEPLVHALACSEWQMVEPFYGQPIGDGFTIGITGGGKHTGFADPPTEPVAIPVILNDVISHLATLWPSGEIMT